MSGCFKWVVILWTVLIGATFIVGMFSAGDAINSANLKTDAEKAGAGLGVTIGAMFYAVLWAVIVIPCAILYLVTKPAAIKALQCPHCGAGYGEGTRFCPSCGKQP